MSSPSVDPSVKGGSPLALDAPSAVEFMREAFIKISEEEIGVIAEELQQKRNRFAPLLSRYALTSAKEEDLLEVLESVFATRKRAADILADVGAEPLRNALLGLVHGEGDTAERFNRFDAALARVSPSVRRDLAGEALHFHDPERYWLWSRWMWNPETRTGALPLVLVGDEALQGDTPGDIYMRVGEAVETVRTMADELGFHRMRTSPFAVDVYLAGIYGVYMYTVTRIRMTQEFNRVIPKLPELLRRLFGVYRLEG